MREARPALRMNRTISIATVGLWQSALIQLVKKMESVHVYLLLPHGWPGSQPCDQL